jgi:hypothetical protein
MSSFDVRTTTGMNKMMQLYKFYREQKTPLGRKRDADVVDALISRFNYGDKMKYVAAREQRTPNPPTKRDILIWTACNVWQGVNRSKRRHPRFTAVAKQFRINKRACRAIYHATNKAMKELFDPPTTTY